MKYFILIDNEKVYIKKTKVLGRTEGLVLTEIETIDGAVFDIETEGTIVVHAEKEEQEIKVIIEE